MAARSRGPTLATGLCAISVNPVALPRPNNVPDADRRRNQTERLKTIRDGLLLVEYVVIERPKRELRSINGSLLRSEINATRFG
jgi:hypothetical protein